jgi:3-hydroxypropanoate dehydrogenase
MIATDTPTARRVIGDEALDQLFRLARTPAAWRPDPVSDALLREIWELARMGPTASNSTPARILFIRSAEAKQRLRPLVNPSGRERVISAPVTAIIGTDFDFVDTLPQRFPLHDAKVHYVGNEAKIERTARLNGALQGAYFMLAARALGLDCGPVSGYNAPGVDAEFFPSGRIHSLMLCSLGHGDPSKLPPRPPRPTFEEVCQLL